MCFPCFGCWLWTSKGLRVRQEGYCWWCQKRLVPVGHARAGGRDHADWATRRYHKKCWLQKRREEDVQGAESDEEDQRLDGNYRPGGDEAAHAGGAPTKAR